MLRAGTADDYAALGETMFAAVREGPSLYTERQRQAWVPTARSGEEWNARLGRQEIILSERGQEIEGFMTLAEGGYIDFVFIRPESQGTGLFRRLFEAIRQRAQQHGVNRLWVHASLTAEPAFSAMGFTILREEAVEVGGETLKRFEMEMTLPAQ